MAGDHGSFHHLGHVLLLGGAVATFLIFVAIEVRRHGRPTFTWRIRGDDRAE